MNHDIVYILRNNPGADELRYSLRSVERNFPHGRVWFFGGCPNGIRPDVYVNIKQRGGTKWERSTNSLRVACETEDLTEDFWLFNDDFFVLEPVRSLPYMVRGELATRIQDIVSRRTIHKYADYLDMARKSLEEKGYGSMDYALHVPMLINKQKALEVLNTFRCPMFRSLYGNYWKVGGILTVDVKIHNTTDVPKEGQLLVSTNDRSFSEGEVGRFIKSRFTEPSKWEKDK